MIESGVFVQTKLLGPCLDLDLEPTAEPGRIWRSIGSYKFLFPLAQYAMPEVNRSKTTSNVHNKPKLSKNFLSWYEKCYSCLDVKVRVILIWQKRTFLGLNFKLASILWERHWEGRHLSSLWRTVRDTVHTNLKNIICGKIRNQNPVNSLNIGV